MILSFIFHHSLPFAFLLFLTLTFIHLFGPCTVLTESADRARNLLIELGIDFTVSDKNFEKIRESELEREKEKEIERDILTSKESHNRSILKMERIRSAGKIRAITGVVVEVQGLQEYTPKGTTGVTGRGLSAPRRVGDSGVNSTQVSSSYAMEGNSGGESQGQGQGVGQGERERQGQGQGQGLDSVDILSKPPLSTTTTATPTPSHTPTTSDLPVLTSARSRTKMRPLVDNEARSGLVDVVSTRRTSTNAGIFKTIGGDSSINMIAEGVSVGVGLGQGVMGGSVYRDFENKPVMSPSHSLSPLPPSQTKRKSVKEFSQSQGQGQGERERQGQGQGQGERQSVGQGLGQGKVCH